MHICEHCGKHFPFRWALAGHKGRCRLLGQLGKAEAQRDAAVRLGAEVGCPPWGHRSPRLCEPETRNMVKCQECWRRAIVEESTDAIGANRG